MNLGTYLFNKTSLFTAITADGYYPFLDGLEIKLDNNLKIFYGEREFFAGLENLSITEAANLINLNFKNSWNNLNELNLIEINSGLVNTTTETLNSNSITENNSSSENKLAAMNTATMISESGVVGENSGSDLTTSTKTISNNIIDYNRDYSLLLQRSSDNLHKKICEDVAEFLTLSIL